MLEIKTNQNTNTVTDLPNFPRQILAVQNILGLGKKSSVVPSRKYFLEEIKTQSEVRKTREDNAVR